MPGKARLWYDTDNDPNTPAIQKSSLIDIVNDSPNWTGTNRSDARFGQDPNGEVFFSSKRNGEVYLITSTLPGGPGGFSKSFTDSIQAETGTPLGSAGIASEHAGYTGYGFIDDLISTGSGVKGLSVTTAEAGTYELDVRYAAGPHGPAGTRTIGVIVNGQRQTQLSFDSTGAWSNWSNSTVSINLPTGTNTIDLIVQDEDTGWINLDSLRIE